MFPGIHVHKMAYEPWTDEEEQKLMEMHNVGFSINQIAQVLQRLPTAIASRLKKIEMRNH